MQKIVIFAILTACIAMTAVDAKRRHHPLLHRRDLNSENEGKACRNTDDCPLVSYDYPRCCSGKCHYGRICPDEVPCKRDRDCPQGLCCDASINGKCTAEARCNNFCLTEDDCNGFCCTATGDGRSGICGKKEGEYCACTSNDSCHDGMTCKYGSCAVWFI